MNISGGQAIGTALTSGIQDISALLPLLGTEQCEEHVASALTDGFLYAAATPLSIFGSLGAARAGFKALVSATSIPRLRFAGAKVLADAGYKPQGVNLSLIMLDQDNRERYCAEKRLQSMMAELHFKDSNRISVTARCWSWNIKMIFVTAVCCTASITPYIHLNLHTANTLSHFVGWAFPVIRAIGGFLTATMMQLVIQSRAMSIMRKHLILNSLGEEELGGLGMDEKGRESWARFPTLDQRCWLLEQLVQQRLNPPTQGDETQASSIYTETKDNHDLESGTLSAEVDGRRVEDLRTRIIEANGSSVLKGTCLLLLFIGVAASVVGYVGCFTVVQGSRSSTGPLVWLCLEAGLSVIRIILWGLNPKGDDAPPLALTIKLDKYAPLPTCTRPAEEIESTRILPLVRAPAFLKAITSYSGLLTQFSHPKITLYYTLTRRNYALPESSKRILYITIFDHTERTTRIYSEDWNIDTTSSEPTYFYSADELTVDLEHGILTTKIGQPIQHQYDQIARNAKLRIALAEHYSSILRQVNSGIGNRHLGHDIVENDWTLKLGEKKSEMQKFEEKQGVTQTFGDADALGIFGGRGDRRDEKAAGNGDFTNIKRDQIYLEQRRVENKVRDLIRDRGQQIDFYMNWVYLATDDELHMMKIRHIEVEPTHEMFGVEKILLEERREMELMLVDEVREWEEKLKECRRGVIARLSSESDGGIDAEMAAKLARRWGTDLWQRLKDGELAMKARMNAAGSTVLKREIGAELEKSQLKGIWEQHTSAIQEAWRPLFIDFRESVATLTSSPPRLPSCRLKQALDDHAFYEGQDRTALRRWQERQKKRAIRLRGEVEDVEERLERGLEHCDKFRSSPELVRLTHSDSKWLAITSFDDDVIKALKRNKHDQVIHLSLVPIYQSFSDADITLFFDNFKSISCTSIHCWQGLRIPNSVLQKLSPNILSITCSHPPLEALNSAVEQNRSRLEGSRTTTVEFANLLTFDLALFAAGIPSRSSSFTVRFFGPESSDHLTLQVIHRCRAADAYLEVVLKGSPFTFPITKSDEFELQCITIGNNRKHASGLTFEPGHRNTLTFILPTQRYQLLDVELLDTNWNRYDGIV